MTPEAYALSLAQKGHTAQSILVATGVSLDQARPAPRREFVYRPFVPPRPQPATYTGEKFGPSALPVATQITREIQRIAYNWNVSADDLLGRCRKPRFSRPRQELMYVLYTKYDVSLPRVGRILGKHHTTVLYGIRNHCKKNNLDYELIARPACWWGHSKRGER